MDAHSDQRNKSDLVPAYDGRGQCKTVADRMDGQTDECGERGDLVLVIVLMTFTGTTGHVEVLDQHIDECHEEESCQEQIRDHLERVTLVLHRELVCLGNQHHEQQSKEDPCTECDEEMGLSVIQLPDLWKVCPYSGDDTEDEHVAQQYNKLIHTVGFPSDIITERLKYKNVFYTGYSKTIFIRFEILSKRPHIYVL